MYIQYHAQVGKNIYNDRLSIKFEVQLKSLVAIEYYLGRFKAVPLTRAHAIRYGRAAPLMPGLAWRAASNNFFDRNLFSEH